MNHYTLKENKTLTSLDLGYNQIGDEGAKLIADLIQRNCKIRDDFFTLVKAVLVGQADKLPLLKKMQEVPHSHQTYALAEIIKEANKPDQEEKDISGHLEIIKFFLDNKVPVSASVLKAVKEAKNPQIEELFRSINQQTSTSSTKADKPSTSTVPTQTETAVKTTSRTPPS